MGFLVGFDGVDIACGGRKRHVNRVLAGVFEQLLQQVMGALFALAFNHGGQGVHPFAGFLRIGIERGGAE